MQQSLVDFLLLAGDVKRLKQRGFVLRGIEDPSTVGGHGFREAIMAWVLGNAAGNGLDTEKLMKISLIHDLCAGYAGDITPYEPIIWRGEQKGDVKKVFEKWVRLPKKEKEYFYEQQRATERKYLKSLLKHLPEQTAREMEELWYDYEKGKTREGRFVQQIDMLENFIQALECWNENKEFPIDSWWQQMKELINEPVLAELLEALDDYFYQNGERGQRMKH